MRCPELVFEILGFQSNQLDEFSFKILQKVDFYLFFQKMERKTNGPVQNIRVLPRRSSKRVWSFNKILYFFQRFPCARSLWSQLERSMVASLLNVE